MRNKTATDNTIRAWWTDYLKNKSMTEEMSAAEMLHEHLVSDDKVVEELLKLKWKMKKLEAKEPLKSLMGKERQKNLTCRIMSAIANEDEACNTIPFKLPNKEII